MLKYCPKCKITKPIDNFYNCQNTRDKHKWYCKECGKQDRLKYYYEHRDKELVSFKKYAELNRERLLLYKKQYRQSGHGKEVIRESSRRRLQDPHNRIAHTVRVRIGNAIRSGHKTLKSIELTGCSLQDLKVYIEAKFDNGMTWKNFGKWHIDHIKPCSKFDLTKADQQKECFNFRNLQPLWAKDNLKKHASWT